MYKNCLSSAFTYLANIYRFTFCVLATVDVEELINRSDLFLCVSFVSSLNKVIQAYV